MPLTGFVRSKVENYLNMSDIKVGGKRAWDIKIHDDSVYWSTIFKGTLGFGDSYTAGKWDVKELDVFFDKLLNKRTRQKRFFKTPLTYLHNLQSKFLNTQIGKRAFHVGEHHYNLGNEMYEYMLGESMAYSSALYLNKNDSLTQAQYNKFEALCRELHLQPGMKVLEIGSGWGTFAEHAAKNYGVEVLGLTVSKEQKKYAEKRCQDLPVRFELIDYQKLDDSYTNAFDRVVSIEMIEAVGKKNFKTYFRTIEKVLKDDGLLGLQAIVGTGGTDPFLSTRIFPNGLVPSEKDIVKNTEGRLRIKHWRSFGTDYDKTLMEWDRRFRKHWPEIKKITDAEGEPAYDERFYRMWRYYLLCCAGSFRAGLNDDCQIIMSKPHAHSTLK